MDSQGCSLSYFLLLSSHPHPLIHTIYNYILSMHAYIGRWVDVCVRMYAHMYVFCFCLRWIKLLTDSFHPSQRHTDLFTVQTPLTSTPRRWFNINIHFGAHYLTLTSTLVHIDLTLTSTFGRTGLTLTSTLGRTDLTLTSTLRSIDLTLTYE